MGALSTSFSQSTADQIKERLETIRKEGYPVTLEELDKWYTQPPPVENAADVLIEGYSRLVKWDWEKEKKFPFFGTGLLRTEPMPEETRALIAQYLTDNQEALKLLHKGARIKLCRYPIRFTDGHETIRRLCLPNARQAEFTMALEALYFAEAKKSDRAAESIIDSLGIARSFAKEPMPLLRAVGVLCHAISISTLEQVINRTVLTDSQLAGISAALNESDDPEALTRALVCERCRGLEAFSKPAQLAVLFLNYDSAALEKLSKYASIPSATLDLDKLTYLDLMARVIQSSKIPLPERLQAAEEDDSRFEYLPKPYLISRFILSFTSGKVIQNMKVTARRRVAQTALAVERYRLAKGRPPRRLSYLAPKYMKAVPADPFDGKPLRYKALDKGYVVYSVGADGEDNGGTEKDANGLPFQPGTDLTFIVEH